MRAHLLTASLSLSLALAAPVALAQTATPRERFARGVALSAEGDWRTALLEFRAAYDGTQNPAVLFNIAAAHEHLNEYVEALEALERYQRLAPPSDLRRHRDEVVTGMSRLVNRIGMLRVVTSAPSPRCTLDGQPQGLDALRAGMRVSAGRRAVRCEAAGFQPREVIVDVAPNAVSQALVELVRVRATVSVTADRAGAEVRVDGRVVGRTPLAEPVLVDEGVHRVEVSHPGYDTVERAVEARGDGARVEATLRWSETVPSEVAARLVVRTNESGAVATLDGHRIPTDGSRGLPPGVHRLRVERDDHLPVERDVDLSPAARTVEDVVLAPTPTYRETYLARARRQRRAWQVVGAAGLGLTVVGGVILGVTIPAALDADSRAAAADAQFQRCTTGGMAICDPMETRGYASARDAAIDERDGYVPLAAVGGVIAGVGLVGAIVSAVLWSDADALDRFERPPSFRVGFAPNGATLEASF